jgi:hypothetical protein
MSNDDAGAPAPGVTAALHQDRKRKRDIPGLACGACQMA